MWGAHNSQKICRIRVGSKSKEFLSQIPKRAQFLCASKLFQAVESSDHHKYRLLYFREYCTFDGFAPAIPNAVYTCPLSVISSCPEYLSGWKVAVQCASDRTEYVHNMGRIYRNPACAICNVESDDSLDLSLLSWAKEDLLSSLTNLYQTNNDDQFGLRFDGYSIFCCRSCPEKFSMCSNVNVTSWGSILHPITKHCLPVPFRTDCDQIPSGNLMLNIDLQELCPQFYDMCPESTTTTLPTSTLPTSTVEWWGGLPGRGSPLEVAFDPSKSEIRPIEIIKTDLVEDNTTYLLCGNGSIRDPEMEINYRALQLHRGLIKVCHTRLSVIDTCLMKALSAIVYQWLDFGLLPRCPQFVWCHWGGRVGRVWSAREKSLKILPRGWELNPGRREDRYWAIPLSYREWLDEPTHSYYRGHCGVMMVLKYPIPTNRLGIPLTECQHMATYKQLHHKCLSDTQLILCQVSKTKRKALTKL